MRRLSLVGLVLLGACDVPGGGIDETEASGSVAATDAPDEALPAEPAEPSEAASATQPVPAAKAALVLDAGGFSASGTRFAFGARQKAVEDAMRKAVGGKLVHSRNAGCGAGPMAFAQSGSFTANFQDGRLVGWLAEEGTRAVTIDGIRPGITMADLASERSVQPIEGSTLDGEFEYALPDGTTLSGFPTGEGVAAKVVSLYAGANCFFR